VNRRHVASQPARNNAIPDPVLDIRRFMGGHDDPPLFLTEQNEQNIPRHNRLRRTLVPIPIISAALGIAPVVENASTGSLPTGHVPANTNHDPDEEEVVTISETDGTDSDSDNGNQSDVQVISDSEPEELSQPNSSQGSAGGHQRLSQQSGGHRSTINEPGGVNLAVAVTNEDDDEEGSQRSNPDRSQQMISQGDTQVGGEKQLFAI
jgi:hypothetical protein